MFPRGQNPAERSCCCWRNSDRSFRELELARRLNFPPSKPSAIKKGLLLPGGHGTRLHPLTFTGNKHTIAIASRPIPFYGWRHLAVGGIREVALALGPLHEGVSAAVGDGSELGLEIT